jgi:hypothetical protein
LAIRRWAAKELTKDTSVKVVWAVRKSNLNQTGVTGLLSVNGKLVDFEAIEGNDNKGEVRRYRVTLKSTDVVDSGLSPVGPSGDREDGADGSETRFWIDTKALVATITLARAGVRVAQGQCTVTWNSEPGAQYSVWGSTDLKAWKALKAGLDSGGATTTYRDALGSPTPAYKFYPVSQP